ncbi:hypothetical protein LCGC14_1684700, partial [marine sediment metagenome]
HIALIYIGLKEYDKALVSFENVLKHELDAESYSRMGTIHFIRKEFDKAEKEFKTTLKIDPENALERTNKKFIGRFQYLEEKAKALGKPMKEMTLAEMDVFWEEAKRLGDGR